MNLGAKSGRTGTANREQQEAVEQTLIGTTCKSGMGPLGVEEGTGGPGVVEPFGIGLKVGFGWGSISAIVQ